MIRFDPKTQLPRDLLEQLYNQEHLTIEEIADKIGCGATTVGRALRRYGIPIRATRDYRLEISRDELERLYIEEGLTEDEIGSLFNCHGRTIGRRLKELGIPTRTVGPVPAHTVPSEVFASWSPNLAYAVGLLATDGNLDKDRVRVEFISTDQELVELYCRALHLDDIHVVFTPQESRKSWYKVKVSDRAFRAFLESIGLTPVKSKTLGALQIPDDVFPDFLRGALDGDGSWYISKSWFGRYQYLCADLCSASRSFLEWVREKVEQFAGLQVNLQRHSLGRAYYLLYKGTKALALGRWVYYSPDVLGLTRKRHVWEQMENREIRKTQ